MHKIVRREIFDDVVLHMEKPEITLITGARQVGKTVLMNMVKEWLINEKNIPEDNVLSFNLDLIKDWEFFQDQSRFIEFLRGKSENKKLYVFVDEAQRVNETGRFFKGIYDSNLPVKLILTGSSSFELKTKLKESLSGRKRVFPLYTFSFKEYLEAKHKNLSAALSGLSSIPDLKRKEMVSCFREYALWGGYPRVVFGDDKEEKLHILNEIYSSYIEKDIVGLLDIRNKLSFSNMVKLLAGQIGQLVNISELANSLNLDRATCERYIRTLTDTFVINPILPYFKNSRQEIIKQNKIYFLDTGLRNYSVENFSTFAGRADAGLLIENAIFKELLISLGTFDKIRFWRTKPGAEVDFLIINDKRILPVEIKTAIKKPTIPSGLRSFIEKYKPEKALVVGLGIFNQSVKVSGTTVYFIHPYELPKFFK